MGLLMGGRDKADMERTKEESPERVATMMTDEEVASTNFNPHPHLRALEVYLDQLTAERDHLKAAVEHQRAELDRLRGLDPVQRGHSPGTIPKGAFADMGPQK